VFADLWEPVKKRLNTTHTAYGASDSTNSLTGDIQECTSLPCDSIKRCMTVGV
jgi:hypothetical protein